jgi:hypothetical protein
MTPNDAGRGHNGHGNEAARHAARMVDEAKALRRSISDASTRLQRSLDLRGRLERSPIASVLVAAGLGYLLGGGLFSPLTKRALQMGAKIALIPLVRGQISALAGNSVEAAGEPL